MQADDLLSARNTLTQSMQDNAFEFTVRLDLAAMKPGVHAGLAMFEQSASGLEIIQSDGARQLSFFHLSERVAGRPYASCRSDSACACMAIRPSISTRSTTATPSNSSARPRPSASVGGKARGPLSLLTPRSSPTPAPSISTGSTTSRWRPIPGKSPVGRCSLSSPARTAIHFFTLFTLFTFSLSSPFSLLHSFTLSLFLGTICPHRTP